MLCQDCGKEATPTLSQHLKQCAAHQDSVLLDKRPINIQRTQLPVPNTYGDVVIGKNKKGLCSWRNCRANRTPNGKFCKEHAKEYAKRLKKQAGK